MSDERKFVVESLTSNRWSDEAFETLAKAEDYARKQAFRNGEDYGIYTLIARAEKPQIVNDVKITAVQ